MNYRINGRLIFVPEKLEELINIKQAEVALQKKIKNNDIYVEIREIESKKANDDYISTRIGIFRNRENAEIFATAVAAYFSLEINE